MSEEEQIAIEGIKLLNKFDIDIDYYTPNGRKHGDEFAKQVLSRLEELGYRKVSDREAMEIPNNGILKRDGRILGPKNNLPKDWNTRVLKAQHDLNVGVK